jgi:hypothetical protein
MKLTKDNALNLNATEAAKVRLHLVGQIELAAELEAAGHGPRVKKAAARLRLFDRKVAAEAAAKAAFLRNL